MSLKTKTIREAFSSDNKADRIAAINACCGRSDIPINLLESALNDDDPDIVNTAKKACESIIITPSKVYRGQYSSSPEIVLATLRSATDQGFINLEMIIQCLKHKDDRIKNVAAEACNKVFVPTELGFAWINSGEVYHQLAAVYACKNNEEISELYLGIMLDIRNSKVHSEALKVEAKIPRTSTAPTFSPPEKVYKKCLGNVIVVATIPDGATTYGSKNGPCRTNRAKIINIKGTFYGEKVGVSMHDLATTYRIGDEIEFTDKEFGDTTRVYDAPGFYFFCTEELAKIFNL